MYRLTDIVDSFKSLVGWEQSNSNSYVIDTSLTTSDSGLYFQEAHPLLTLRAMDGIMPKDWGEKYSDYSLTTTYAKGDCAYSGTQLYMSLQDNNVGHSVLDSTWWKSYNLLSTYLESLETRGIKKVVQRFVTSKIADLESRSIVDSRTLFDGAGRLSSRVENSNSLCGFEITPLREKGITMRLEKIGLQFVGNSGSITFYLFHSSKKSPVATKSFTYNGNGSYQWFDLGDLLLPYVTSSTNAGGSWYLVYNQRSLPSYMEAINFARDWSREPCGTCNKGDAQLYHTMMRYFELSPFCVGVDEDWDTTLWDIELNKYTNTNNYGINLQFSLLCDLTDLLIGSRTLFSNAIQLQVASEALRTLALNPEVEVNRVQYNADRDNILYETDGNGQGIRGLNGELERAYKALAIDTKGLDPLCLGCHNKGIHIGSI